MKGSELAEWLYTMELQNTNGRENEDEMFMKGIEVGISHYEEGLWISVKDNPPEIDSIGFSSLIGYNPFWGRCMLNAEYICDTKFIQWKTWCGESITPPTHYMPLPEPPKQ